MTVLLGLALRQLFVDLNTTHRSVAYRQCCYVASSFLLVVVFLCSPLTDSGVLLTPHACVPLPGPRSGVQGCGVSGCGV